MEKLLDRRWSEAVLEYDFKEFLKHKKIDPSDDISDEKKEELLRSSKFLTQRPVAFLREMMENPTIKVDDKITGGLSDNKTKFKVKKSELLNGLKTELEHTNDIDTAAEIALDHLEEMPNYYSELSKIEKGGIKEEPLDTNKEWELNNAEPPHDDFQLWALEPAKVEEASRLPIDLRDKSDKEIKRSVYFIDRLSNPSVESKEVLYKNYLVIKQNIKRAIAMSADPNMFYTKLMDLQSYLSKLGVINEDGTSLYVGVNGNDGDLIGEAVENFNIEDFKQIRSFAERVNYAKEHLQFLGQGSSRMAFKFHDNKILKLAKNSKGVAQNATEADIGDQEYYQEVVAQVFEFDRDFNWLISEYAPRMTDAQFKQIEGYDFRTLGIYLTSEKYGRHWEKDVTPEEHDAFIYSPSPNRLATGLENLMSDYDLPVGDLIAKTSYGVSHRDGEQAIILIDYGLDEDVYQNYYKRVRETVLREMKQYFTERVLSSMPDSSTVEVKDECKLGGNGDGTSTACNQGEIKNFKIKDLKEQLGETFNPLASQMKAKLESLSVQFASAAQKVYDEWEQDEEGHDEIYGSGGICDDIADDMCDVVHTNTSYGCFTKYDEYACHTSIYVYDIENKILMFVDISPYNYETGGGYTWKKIPDVKFQPQMVDVSDQSGYWDTFFDENGEMIQEDDDKKLTTTNSIVEGNVKKSDRIDIYRDSDVVVVRPLTFQASCKYGAHTKWCTSAPSNESTIDKTVDFKLIDKIEPIYKKMSMVIKQRSNRSKTI
ncbi:MAG: hypothetical protein HC836_46415 [Richelia sp. RM2_1_2]|nr:hypothetical protein [Richelia sp. RM2_1_2]